MQFRLLKRRTVSAFATTALAAGALTVPVALMAAPAQAGEATGAFSCAYGNFKLAYDATINVAGAWDNTTGVKKFAFTGELSDMTLTGVPAQFVNFPNVTTTATLEGTMGGKSVTLNGQGTGTFIGSGKLDVPTVKGQVGAADAASDLSVTKVILKVVSNDPAKPLTADIPCTPTAPINVKALPSLVMSCTTFGSTFGYATEPEIAAVATLEGKTKMSVGLGDMPGVVPVPLANVPVSGVLNITAAGTAAQLKGVHTIASVPPSAPIAVPTLSGEMNSTATSTTFSVDSAAFNAVASGMSVDIPCAVNQPTTYTVDVQPVPAACVEADEALTAAEADVALATTAVNDAAADEQEAAAAVATATAAVESAQTAANTATAALNAATAKVASTKAEVDAATAAVNSAPGEIAAATAKVNAANAAVSAAAAKANATSAAAAKAKKAATKAKKAYKKAASKAKKAKSKKAKSKANKAKSKAKKAKSKADKAKSKAYKAKSAANRALAAARTQLSAATAELAAANAKPAAASNRLAAAKSALTAAEAAVTSAKEKSVAADSALADAKAALEGPAADLATAKEKSAAAATVLANAKTALAAAQAAFDEEC
ncbi:hypothetical protein [Aeromicrobium wangtongii]|uniref:hypothetical protein n=1 Tax=Aeromicrobium wangtongii TaxID=2969247 RepID=UPI0020178CD1|nr:hypothetical protein [Aeromicrobium wangtongii]MCL3818716.1 hypothetical protein [Aeromicrobium wangtongii]